MVSIDEAEVIKTLPCIKRTCLKYPACKHKTTILCNDLAGWIKHTKPMYLKLKETFPELETVGLERRSMAVVSLFNPRTI